MPRTRNISIKGRLVSTLRHARRLTQNDLARLVYQRQGKAHLPDRDALERRCRDWEVKGIVGRDALKALAAVLRVSESYLLQGDEPDASPDRIAQIADRLREQVTAGASAAVEFVAGIRELSSLGGIQQLPDDAAAYWEAARALEARLGSAQLTADHSNLVVLARILDWTTADLRTPAAAHPYWLVEVSGAFESGTALVRGIEAAEKCINARLSTWCLQFGARGRQAVFVDQGPWFRIYLEFDQHPELDQVVSVARCEPGEEGLKYTAITDEQRNRLAWAVLPELQPSFFQIGRLKLISPWALVDQTDCQLRIRDFVGPIQPFCLNVAHE